MDNELDNWTTNWTIGQHRLDNTSWTAQLDSRCNGVFNAVSVVMVGYRLMVGSVAKIAITTAVQLCGPVCVVQLCCPVVQYSVKLAIQYPTPLSVMIFKLIKSSYDNVKQAFVKTGSLLGSKLRSLFQGKIDEDTLEKLEQTLYEADLGVAYAQELTDKVRQHLKKNPQATSEELLEQLRHDILASIPPPSADLIHPPVQDGPVIILVVGVNGNGKTTTVARLARHFQSADKKVLIGAADTFRAAATEQLETWALRLNVDIVKGVANCDPAAVVFDAVTAGKARKADIVIIDTAGRLHTKTPLMQELEKIRRSCRKLSTDAPHETLLVLDATTGQNAIDQARTFHKFTPITGLVLTKLDGSAKGGIVLAIQKQLGIPVKFIGVGEGMDDLQIFDPRIFVETLFN